MTRIVIQITSEGVHLCNDGTMWKKGEYSKWYQLDSVPQPEPIDYASIPGPQVEFAIGG